MSKYLCNTRGDGDLDSFTPKLVQGAMEIIKKLDICEYKNGAWVVYYKRGLRESLKHEGDPEWDQIFLMLAEKLGYPADRDWVEKKFYKEDLWKETIALDLSKELQVRLLNGER